MFKQRDYTVLVATLETKIGNHHLKQVYVCPLKTKIQHQTETLQTYGTHIEKLGRLQKFYQNTNKNE